MSEDVNRSEENMTSIPESEENKIKVSNSSGHKIKKFRFKKIIAVVLLAAFCFGGGILTDRFVIGHGYGRNSFGRYGIQRNMGRNSFRNRNSNSSNGNGSQSQSQNQNQNKQSTKNSQPNI